jgi:glycerol-3-phosphate acyltransferase PlsX
MGGDFGPPINVEGAVQACQEWPDLEILLVGDQIKLTNEIKKIKSAAQLPIHIHHSPTIVDMHESPVEACRAKPDSSIMTCAKLLADNQVAGLVSAGNSGATMTASLFHLRRLEGISRPAIASLLPTIPGHCVMLDMGANVDCKPKHLLQFAIMGAVYFGALFKITRPKVGLLSIGEEEGKGNELTQETHHLLKNSGLNYIGNIEGRDIPMGKADVVVCDGFVGNVVLKFGEGLSEALLKLIRQEIKKHPLAMLGGFLLQGGLKDIKKKVDPSFYGGAPLLGVNGVSIVSHGGSNSIAIKNALRVASELIKDNINEHIETQLKNTSTSFVLS